MSKEILIIKNFGPIKSVDLDLGKITILIGEQASGKSTAAKILAVCRYFSYIVNFKIDIDKQSEFHSNKQFAEGLKQWGIRDYVKENSQIIYKCDLYQFEFQYSSTKHLPKCVVPPDEFIDGKFKFYTRIISESTQFTALLNQLETLKSDDKLSLEENNIKTFGYSWSPNENFYRLNVKKVMDNPLFVPAERGFQSLSVGKDSLLPDAIIDELAKINKIVRGYNTDTDIKPLDVVFRNENGLSKIKKAGETYFYLLHTGASGYQSTIPIVLAIKFYNEVEKRRRTFIIEEPEINLFPSTQKKLMEFFVANINDFGHSFLIPTHSPYFLTVINDLLLAYKKGKINEKVTEAIINKKSWLNPKDLRVYEFRDGIAKGVFDKKINLINDNIIDEVSDELNEEFDELLDIK